MTAVTFEAKREQGVALITFDGEERLNAFGRETWVQLGEALERLNEEDDLGVAVLTGRGRAFVAGADINLYVDASLAEFIEFQKLVRRVTGQLEDSPKPVIAAVNGYALGGGFEIVLACDLVVSSRAAKFGLPEAKLGLLPGGGGTQRLPRAVGRVVANELIMTGRTIDAEEAWRLNLVNRLVEAEALIAAAFGLAAEVRFMAPLAVRMAKRLIRGGLDLPLPDGLELEGTQTTMLYETHDKLEGVSAFVQKRPPSFSGH